MGRSIDILLLSFKALTCRCNFYVSPNFFSVHMISSLPISAMKEFLAIFNWDTLLRVVECLIFLYKKKKKKKKMIEYDSFIIFFFVFLFFFRIFKCRVHELIFQNVYVNFSNVLFIVSFKNHFVKIDSEQGSHGYNKILRKIY